MFSQPLVYDFILFSYLSLNAYLLREKFDRITDSLEGLVISIVPYLLIIGLASASFAADRSAVLSLAAAILSSTVYSLVLKFFNSSKKYIYGALLGYAQLMVFILYIKISIDFLLLFKMLSLAFTVTILPVLVFAFFESIKLKIAYPIYAHFLDASSTVIALESGLKEKAYLARAFIELVGAGGVFLMKFLVIFPISYYLLENYEGKWREEAFFFLVVYGFVLFLRNYFLILMT